MQTRKISGLEKRIVYYGSKYFVLQDSKGEDYFRLKPVYEILLLNSILYEKDADYIHVFKYQDEKHKRTIDSITLYIIELPKVEYSENMTDLEKWCYFIRNYTKENKRSIIESMIEESEDFQMVQTLYNDIDEDFWEAIQKLHEEKPEIDRKLEIGFAVEEAVSKVEKEKEQALQLAQKEKEAELAKAEMEKEQVQKEMILSMYEYGDSIDKIAFITKEDVSYIESIINNK